MKRTIFWVLVIGVLIFVGWRFVNPNRLMADVYYVKVPSAETVDQTADGYRYEVIGYDTEGKKRPLTISTTALLAEGDFLKVYVKEEDPEVMDYDRVNSSEVPRQLKEEQLEESPSSSFP